MNQNLIFNVKNEVSPKLIKNGGFTNLSVLITGKIMTKIHTYFLTTLEGVKINLNLIFDVKIKLKLYEIIKNCGFVN